MSKFLSKSFSMIINFRNNFFSLPFSLSVLIFSSSCLTQKTELEFNKRKSEVMLRIKPAKRIEKVKGINVIFTEYLQKSPTDSVLLNVFNTYLQYQLDRYGYSAQVLFDPAADQSFLSKNDLSYSVDLSELKIKEFKKRDTEKDEASGTVKTVKLRGLEVSSEALVLSIGKFFPNETEKPSTPKGRASKEETQEGEFQHTKGVKDLILGDKDGSVKYKYEIKNLEDGVFENLCLNAASDLAREIDYSLKRLYAEQKRKEKKSKK